LLKGFQESQMFLSLDGFSLPLECFLIGYLFNPNIEIFLLLDVLYFLAEFERLSVLIDLGDFEILLALDLFVYFLWVLLNT
jgi:hypothetical protein